MTYPPRAHLLAAILLCAPAAACAPGGTDLGAGADAGLTELQPRLDVIQEYIFTPGCAMAGCHDVETRAGALDLSDVHASYRALVNRPVVNAVASENGWLLVKPGDPELSFLVRKLRVPGLGEGAPMPIGEFQISEFYLDVVEDWIARGAPQ